MLKDNVCDFPQNTFKDKNFHDNEVSQIKKYKKSQFFIKFSIIIKIIILF